MKTRIAAGIVACVGLWLGGCTSVDRTVSGKVIEGKVSMIGRVPSNDPRLEGPGLEGVKIVARLDAMRRGGATVVDGLSGPDGQIKLKTRDLKVFSEEVSVAATRDGYTPARQVMVIPSGARRLLIVLQPLSGSQP